MPKVAIFFDRKILIYKGISLIDRDSNCGFGLRFLFPPHDISFKRCLSFRPSIIKNRIPRMNKPYINEALLEIDVVDLQLDPENYRTGPQPGQHEAIQAMIDEQGEKIVELAEDVLSNGLSPIELLAVCPTDDPGKFRVVEGNRRLWT